MAEDFGHHLVDLLTFEKCVAKEELTAPLPQKWLSTKLYCPYCGEQKVEKAEGYGDYCVGPDYKCLLCFEVFQLP